MLTISMPCLSNTDFSKGYRGITAFIVERGFEGFTVGKKEELLKWLGQVLPAEKVTNFAEQWRDVWPILGTVIGTYSVFCLSGIRMRSGFLLGACCWLTNNILVGSIGGTLLEMTVIVMNSTTIYRLYRQRTEPKLNQSVIE